MQILEPLSLLHKYVGAAYYSDYTQLAPAFLLKKGSQESMKHQAAELHTAAAHSVEKINREMSHFSSKLAVGIIVSWQCKSPPFPHTFLLLDGTFCVG